MGIIIGLIIGAIEGFVASKIMNEKSGTIKNIILGIAGGFVGGFVFNLIGFAPTNLLGSLVVSIADISLVIYLLLAIIMALIFKKFPRSNSL